MAYCRWLGSHWYIYWLASSSKVVEEQVLRTWYAGAENLLQIEFKEFRLDAKGKVLDRSIDAAVNRVVAEYRANGSNVTFSEVLELRKHVCEWIKDVQGRE